jgi:hypothetical protein
VKRPPIYILAFSPGQAEQYRRDQGLGPHEVRFILSAAVLRGTLNPDVRRVGNWYDRRDIAEIERVIRTSRMPVAR